ncbi:phospholipase [Natronomonas salina]|uniref:phospholipase D-like domain-containing protein n=1 Tax=Natronomonas salina TaxID=1710540 RepID=UPI0015B693BF|nr:phospholipase D-like domain-containing protein [Natronomonas salina]QLD88394.1 phospholipase [Natronomonas salina]
MTLRRAVLVLALLLACSGCAAATAQAPTATETVPNATLVEAYPNPVADGDPGEFVAVRFREPTNATGWTITDGNTVAHLPNRTVEGTVAFSTAPEEARRHTDRRVAGLDGRLLLADGGDELELRRNGEAVHVARYRNAPESRVREFDAGEWRPVGATDLEPVHTGSGEATAFVLPDADGRTAQTLARADHRLLLAGYTLTSEDVTDALLAARRNGADVRVLLDGSPVGGVTERQARLLDRLADGGVEVRLLDGPHTRYRHHHPKYAVVDDRALVLTENFKPAGTGGMSSRGWGVALRDAAAADALADLHAADREWRAATPWTSYRAGRDFADADPALGNFESRHAARNVSYDAATVLVAPDNAEDALVADLDGADDRILVQQVEIGSRDGRLLRAVLRAADRGVTVRIHLSDGWYVEADNAALAEWLNRRAGAEGWDLEARVDDAAETSVGYEKVHTKGVVVDDAVVLGSLNWANSAGEENREVLVRLDGGSAADYYAGVFESDWATGDAEEESLPAGLLGGVAVAVCGILLVARKVTFVGRDGVVTDWQW